jgi:hypothetical protein
VVGVAFGQVMVGLVGIVCGLAIVIEPSFAARITGWRGPRWPAACSVAVGLTMVLAGFADHLPVRFHLVSFGAAVLTTGVAVVIAHLGLSPRKAPARAVVPVQFDGPDQDDRRAPEAVQ